MSRWTAPELAALRVAPDYPTFAQLTDGTRTYDAWEVKRRRLVSPPAPTWRSRLVAWLVARLG